MNENQIFSPHRFGELVKYEFLTKRKNILLSVCALFAGLIIISFLCSYTYARDVAFYESQGMMDTYNHVVHNTQLIWFVVTFYICGCILASIIFSNMSTRDGALTALTLPASQFEKFICRWLVSVPVYIVLFIIMAMAADWFRVAYEHMSGHAAVTVIDWTNVLFDPNEAGYFDGASAFFILFFIFNQSFFFLGSLVWSRLSFVKTLVAMTVLSIAYACFGGWLFGLMHTPGLAPGEPFGLEDDDLSTLIVVTCIAISLFNYGLSYLRYTESEIIKRW